MLAFVEWPSEPMTVIYNGDCGFCNKARRFFERLDLEKSFRWERSQAGGLDRFGITHAMVRERAYLVAAGRVYGGFRAFRAMLLYNPAVYLLTYIVLAAPDSTIRVFATCWSRFCSCSSRRCSRRSERLSIGSWRATATGSRRTVTA
jgi:predicted DCC family thiol-disulfide oxidoreductase YuxK